MQDLATGLLDATRYGDEVVSKRVDMTDAGAVAAHVAESRPDAIVHCAIMNDWDQMHADRHGAWAAYVEATRNYGDAANAAVSFSPSPTISTLAPEAASSAMRAAF